MFINLFLSLSLITVFEFTAITMGSGLGVHHLHAWNVNVGQRDWILYKQWEPITEQHSVRKKIMCWICFSFSICFRFFFIFFPCKCKYLHSIYGQECSGSLWGTHFTKNSVSLEWIKIFQFCLNIWHLLRLPHPWVGVWVVGWMDGWVNE